MRISNGCVSGSSRDVVQVTLGKANVVRRLSFTVTRRVGTNGLRPVLRS